MELFDRIDVQEQARDGESPEGEDNFLKSYHRNGNRPFKTLIGLYRGNYSRLLLSAAFFIVKHSPVWVLPIIVSEIINAATRGGTEGLRTIVLCSSVMALLVVQNLLTNYLHVRLYSRTIRYVEAGLRGSLVRKLQQLSITYHKEMQSGRLQSKIMRDVEAVETLSEQLFINVLGTMVSLTAALAVTAAKSRIVLLFFLLTLPVAVLIVGLFRRRISSRNTAFRRRMEETSAQVMEMVELIPVTKAHGLENEEILRMEHQINRVADEGYHLDVTQSWFGSVSWVAYQLFQLLCLSFTGYLAWQGRIQVGDVVMYQSYYSSVVQQVAGFISLLPILSKGMESVRSIGDVLLADDVENNRGKKKLRQVRGEVEFSHVSFHYPDAEHPVLTDLNLRVKAGETIAIVGGSGAGKSTLLNLVIGFLKADSGTVKIDGTDIGELDLRAYRHHIAVVPQNTILFSGTIRDNITYGLPTVTDEQLGRAVRAASLGDLIDSLPDGLDARVTEHGGSLSGGQRQRICIARALIRDPDIIVLDEATSALDSISEKKIQNALKNLAAGRTTFIVAHRLSTVRNADRIIVIESGRCVESGSYEELMEEKGAFYRMEQIQS